MACIVLILIGLKCLKEVAPVFTKKKEEVAPVYFGISAMN